MKKTLPMKISGQALLQAIGQKVDKRWDEVTAEDIHKTGHLEPFVFHEQVDLKTAQMLVDHPQEIFESA